jgi:ATP-dependent 26S proteasome regulatory subunit
MNKVLKKLNEAPEYTDTDEDYIEKPTVYSQWAIIGDGSFVPTVKTKHKLTSDIYEPYYSDRTGEWGLIKMAATSDELYQLPSKELIEILEDIEKFWNSEEKYKKYKIVHKRGILLHGEPGGGKSGIIQLCINHLISRGGIVINITNSDDLRGYIKIIPKLREIEPNRPIITILEDIENISSDDSYMTSQLLNLLDGVNQQENIVYIATTNHPELLADRITNRPSRFDRRYYINSPSDDVRRTYIEHKSAGEDIDINQWVKDTNGMSLAHIKELFISVLIMDIKYEAAIKQLKDLKTKPRNNSGETTLGFKK